ncbi:MAG: T9SS type A sorting domain-containing protein, partial [Gemmatimonadetes bacterium]|nr:T9SS type A sorting domain-containing protein [Gemmatimonadota bacterium]
ALMTVTTNDPDRLSASVSLTGDGLGAVDSPVAAANGGDRLIVRAAPNPFLHGSRIEFVTPQAGLVNVSVFDTRGRRIATLLDDWREAGAGSTTWDGRDPSGGRAPAGVYFFRVTSGEEAVSRKLVRLR